MNYSLRLLAKAWIGASTKKLLGSHVTGLLVDTDHGVFAVDPADLGVGRQLRVKGQWASDELGRLERHVDGDSTVLVVGAHVGTLAIPLARKSKAVFAVEANPATYELLTRNIALNGSSNCTPVRIAASDRRGDIPFLLSTANSGGSKRTPKHRSFLYYYDKPTEISVPGDRLDDVFATERFDLVLMDIEGSEYYALQGMQRILSQCRALFVEFVPHHLANVSGVGVEEFLAPIAPHFDRLTIPSLDTTVGRDEFLPRLAAMYARQQADDGIVFEKA